jgi:hypothetical protein
MSITAIELIAILWVVKPVDSAASEYLIVFSFNPAGPEKSKELSRTIFFSSTKGTWYSDCSYS